MDPLLELPGVFGAFGRGVESLSSLALLLGLTTTRVAVAFLVVPLVTAEIIPATIRNALFVSMALLSLALQAPPAGIAQWSAVQWVTLFAKEAFVGGVIGLMFAGMMWAFEAGGQVIDTKVGSSSAQLMDPLSGHQTSLSGAFLARLASWVFMAGGGFMLMVATLIESWGLWPLSATMPALALSKAGWLEAEFGRIMLLTLLIAAPSLVLLHLIEGVLGLVNRFAPQLNVFSLSMSIKTIAAVWVLWAQTVILADALLDDLLQRRPLVIEVLRRILSPS